MKTVDLFCGVGGLSHGFVLEGMDVVAGIDVDPACRYPYEQNNGAVFLQKDVKAFSAKELNALYGNSKIKILAGCAPCQPFSTYAQRYESDGPEGRWGLLYHFARLIREAKPELVTMENVPTVVQHSVFHDFVSELKKRRYHVWYSVVDSANYGVPQRRRRLVLLASKLGPISLIPPTHPTPRTVKQAIGRLKPIEAGEASHRDKLHVSSKLSDLNLLRIVYSKPGGTWRDWPEELVADCHRQESGKTYPGVYGRMEWNKPAPTMTTQCFGYGNGRFGHPDQNRAISLREAALIQSFPRKYDFVPKNEPVSIKALGRLIGNAVPVELGRAIAKSLKQHVHQMQLADKKH